MARDRPEKPEVVDIGAPGLAAGPGPAPPGVDDGTPRATRPAQGEDRPQTAEEQGEEARGAERSAGTRRDELGRSGSHPRRAPGRRGRARR